MIQPYSWQLPAINHTVRTLQSGNIVVNASDTGTGKTICALEAMRLLDRKFLVVAPKAVHTAWVRTAKEMGVDANLLDVINVERLRFKNPWFGNKRWNLPAGAMIIWDEIHRGCAGPKSQTTEILALTKVFKIPVLAMSATVADSPLKMRGLGFLLGLHKFNTGDFYNWCRQHGCMNSPWHSGLEFSKGPLGLKAMLSIHAAIGERMVRMRIADIPEFPENQILCELFDLDESSTDEINKIYAEMDANIKQQEHSNALTEQLRARQRTELLKVPLLRDLAIDACEEGKAPVVFVNFRETLFKLHELLKEQDYDFGKIYGGQKDEERQAFIDTFQANLISGMICMTQAGGVGISLQDVHQKKPRVSYLTPSFNAVEMVQCLGRIHRAGGTKSVQTFVLIAGTIEEKIHSAIKRKLGNISSLNDGDLQGET